jgi:hypothetical protein
MGVAPHPALRWTLFSADLRSLDAGALGFSFFLLVSIRLGDRRFCTSGDCLPEAKDLGADSWQGDTYAAPAAVEREDATRRQHTGALHEGGFCVAGFRTKLNKR